MGYLIAAILVLLLVAAFVTYLVLNATRRSGSAGPADPGAEGNPAGIAAPDESPLGDTTQHSGADAEGGRAREPRESEQSTDTRPESERLANRPR
jgi:hypothetical protein